VFGLNLPSVLTLRVEPAADSAAALFLRDQREVLTLIKHIATRLGVHGGSSAGSVLPDAPAGA